MLAQRARGIDHTPVGDGHEGRKSISREGTFNEDVASSQKLRAVLRAYSESVATQLREKGRRTRTVSLKLRYGDFTTISRSVTLKRPANSNDAIYEAADGLFDKSRAAGRPRYTADWRRPQQLRRGRDAAFARALVDEKQEKLSAAFDQMRTKYGARSLQTGRTAFRGFADGDDRCWNGRPDFLSDSLNQAAEAGAR